MGKRPKNLKGYSIALPLAFAHVMVEHGLSEITDKFVLLLSDKGVVRPVSRQPIDREWTRKYYNRHQTEILALVNKLKEEEEMAKKPVSEKVKGWTGLLKEVAEVQLKKPTKDEMQSSDRTGAWEKLDKYYEELAKVCQKLIDKYFQGNLLKDINFSTAKLRAKWADKKQTQKNPNLKTYEKFKTEIKTELEGEELYDNVWAGMKLAYIDTWLPNLGIKHTKDLTYRHKWELVQVKEESIRKKVVEEFLENWDSKGKMEKKLKVLQDIIKRHEREQVAANSVPTTKSDATLTYDAVVSRLEQGDLSVIKNYNVFAVAMKADNEGKGKDLWKHIKAASGDFIRNAEKLKMLLAPAGEEWYQSQD